MQDLSFARRALDVIAFRQRQTLEREEDSEINAAFAPRQDNPFLFGIAVEAELRLFCFRHDEGVEITARENLFECMRPRGVEGLVFAALLAPADGIEHFEDQVPQKLFFHLGHSSLKPACTVRAISLRIVA